MRRTAELLAGAGVKDLQWLKPGGGEMSDHEWGHQSARALGTYLAGAGIDDVGRRGRALRDDDFLVLFNASDEDLEFVIPPLPGEPWRVVIDTTHNDGVPERKHHPPGERYLLHARSLALLTRSLPEK